MNNLNKLRRDFFKNEVLFEAEQEFQLPLRLAFLGLLACNESSETFRWKPLELKQDILPYDEVDFDEILSALALTGFIHKSALFEEKPYGHLSTRNKYIWSIK
jgi:hypothetical protein